jgi:hypothetical protein
VLDLESGRTLSVWKPTPAEGEWTPTNARATLAHGTSSAIYLTDTSGNVRKLDVRIQQLD